MISYITKKHIDRILAASGKVPAFKVQQIIADICRYNCLSAIKVAGSGHLGSSFSAMDVVVYLYFNRLNIVKKGFSSPDRDIYFSSKGHDVPGLYSVFYALGILDDSALFTLRRYKGLDGHPDVGTKGIESNTGSLGMGLAKAKGMAWAKSKLKSDGHVYVLLGDGELQEGQNYESFQNIAHQKVDGLTAIVDRNRIQTDKLTDHIISLGDLKSKVSSFGWEVMEADGHNYDELDKAIAKRHTIKGKPVLIIANTTKGKGVGFMEYDGSGPLYNWHSGAPDDVNFMKASDELFLKIQEQLSAAGIAAVEKTDVPGQGQRTTGGKASKEFVSKAYGETLVKLAPGNERIVVLDGDLSADCKVRDFENAYPERFIENGIAEQDMVSTAGGLARSGFLPVVNSFASFLVSRANEQIYNNACEKTKIIYACHFAGLLPAGPGKSHQSVRDISLLSAIPNIEIIQPSCGDEARMITEYAVNEAKDNVAIRMVIGPSPRLLKLPEAYKLTRGRGVVLKEGNDGLLFAYGPVMINESLLASDILKRVGYNLKVVNMPWLNRFDIQWLSKHIAGQKNIFVLEDHSTRGGLGEMMLRSLTEAKAMPDSFNLKIFGIEDEFPVCGTPWEVLAHHRLAGADLAKRIFGKDIDASLIESSVEEVYTVDAPQ
jgi:transketolase